MPVYLGRRYQLSASHRLFSEGLDQAANAALFGKCANPHGHGHNYFVQVTLRGTPDPTTGMVMNLTEIDRVVREEVLTPFDHQNLNLHPDFLTTIPTTENFAIAIHRRLAASALGPLLAEVRVEETSNNSFTYTGDAHTLPLEAEYLKKRKA